MVRDLTEYTTILSREFGLCSSNSCTTVVIDANDYATSTATLFLNHYGTVIDTLWEGQTLISALAEKIENIDGLHAFI